MCREFILDGRVIGSSDAMLRVYEHATNWMLTVDCLGNYDGITMDEAKRVADHGFIGDDSRRARRFLNTLPKA